MKASPLRHPARLAGSSLLRLQSDVRLAELAVTGHEAAFDAIVDRYRTPLTRYCAGIVGPSRAEDAVQQALINAHDALQRTDEVRHLRSWLYRIAHNASLNVLRALRDEVPLDDASVRVAAATSSDGPAEAFERSERFRATVAALQELPERQRAALLLRELEGRSHEEIAAALGVTKGSARQHLMRARIAVRGAVTAVTPYPLIARLSETLTAGGGGAGWTDAAVGAGAGATLAKFTAGVAATGALVGGAVGGSHVVHHGDRGGGGGGGGGAGAAAGREVVSAPPRRVVQAVSATPAKVVAPAVRAAAPPAAAKAPAHGRRKGQEHHATEPIASRRAPVTVAAPPASAGPIASDEDHDGRRRDRGSSGKGEDHSNSPGHQRKAAAEDEGDQHADSGSEPQSSGKGHRKAPTDQPKPAKTKPATTTPSDDDSSGPGSGESKKTDDEGSGSDSGSGSGKPASTTEAPPSGSTDDD
jgi:RNA polymerase sigma factor (sigma-70 family)